MIKCKNNGTLPQAVNDEIKNIKEHTYKEDWEVL